METWKIVTIKYCIIHFHVSMKEFLTITTLGRKNFFLLFQSIREWELQLNDSVKSQWWGHGTATAHMEASWEAEKATLERLVGIVWPIPRDLHPPAKLYLPKASQPSRQWLKLETEHPKMESVGFISTSNNSQYPRLYNPHSSDHKVAPPKVQI